MKNRLNLSEKFFPIYRGRTQSGQWKIGAYIPKLHSALTRVPQIFDGENFYPVVSSTIGRDVSLDKNGDVIFEDDVLKFTFTDEDGTHFEYGLICWNPQLCGFVMYSNESALPVDMDCINDGEIIGNIHDNPELLPLFEKTLELFGGKK